MLRFENIGFQIQKKKVLYDVSFSITPGEVVAVIGESGAGKSTIFKLFIGELRPTSGRIFVDQVSLGNITPRDIQRYRRQIGVVFQDFKLLPHKTVFENVAFALEVCDKESDIETRVPELLAMVGLTGKEQQFPTTLSGGEKQRLAIARALIHKPPILIADEPTGNLDPRNAREIGDLFRHLNTEHGLTIICATHDPRLVGILKPRVLKLENGTLTLDQPFSSVQDVFGEMLS